MANQAEHLGRPKEALHLVRNRPQHRRQPQTSRLRGGTTCLDAALAWAHAAQGDTAACDRALGHAVDEFNTIAPVVAAPWTTNINGAFLAARQGHAPYALVLTGRDPRAAGRMVPLLCQAVDHYGPGYARSMALYLPELAGAHALAGDTDTAVTVGHQAVDAVTAVSSPRAHDRLRTLNSVLEPLHAGPGVAELRGRLAAVAA